ncbi:MAG: Slp/YeaY family lipoprotein [Desulfovermiculus sp.]
MKKALLPLMLMVVFTAGCAVVSKDLRHKADPSLTFGQVSDQPVHYAGEIVIWGGYIIENQAGRDRTQLIILQTPLSARQQPQSKDTSAGRFIAVADEYLDPEIYSKNRGVTIAGEVADYTQTVQEDSYGPYPVVHIKEVHLWEDTYHNMPRLWNDPYGPYDPWFGRPYYTPWLRPH